MTTAATNPGPADEPNDAWFVPAIDHNTVRGLMRRTNVHALLTLGAWLLLCLATASAVVMTSDTFWVVPAMVVYGAVLTFAYAASHECAHGTAFRTRWLNESVFWFTSLVFIEEPLYRRYSHAGHHSNTWFNALDPQKPYGIPLTLRRYLAVTLGPALYLDAARQLARHSAGRFTDTERAFLPASDIPKVKFNSRVMAGCYLSLLLGAAALQSAWPLLLYFLPRFLGGGIVTLYINTQHMCMAEDQRDHRLTTRSIRCTWLERLLYWNMNFHIEHHLYPSVPFHALPALSQCVARQLPPPVRSVIAANADILRAVVRQRSEPRFNLSNAD
jgi:fatty acid desaturase